MKLSVGKHNHIPDSKFDEKELKMGIKVEHEHTDNLEIAKSIAKDHLSECPDYYTRLDKMEKECKKSKLNENKNIDLMVDHYLKILTW